MELSKEEFKVLVMLYVANSDGHVNPEEVRAMLERTSPKVYAEMKIKFSKMKDVEVLQCIEEYKKHYTIKQTKVTRNMLALQREDTERNLRIAIRNYNDQMALCVKNYEAANATVSVAQKTYDISEKMFEVGKATMVELNDAQLALAQAQLTEAQAIYNFMVTRAVLDELIGKEK